MFFNPLNFVWVVALLAISQTPACNTQFFHQGNARKTGSISRAQSTASEQQLGVGGLGLSHGVVDSRTVTRNNGGFNNGGTTSVARSRARSAGVNLGGLGIGSTLTSSQKRNNGAVSGALNHQLKFGNLDFGTSLSRDNLRNGVGLQRSQKGGLQLGLGLLNFDLSRGQQPQSSQALTQAQAQAQGVDAFSRSNSQAATQSRQLGLLGLTNTRSQSDAVSGTRYGQTSASAGGYGGVPYYGRRFRRQASFVPYSYSGSPFNSRRQPHGFPSQRFYNQPQNYNFGFPQRHNANAQGLANNRYNGFEQQAGANTQSNQVLNEQGLFQTNGASSIGSNLATDGSSGQLSSANVNQENSLTNDGSQSLNNAQSQALNFDANQQQAANAQAGTKETQTANGERFEAHGDSQATNNNEFGTSSNIAHTNSVVYEEGETQGSQADANSQSIFQGHNGENSAAEANSGVSTVQGPNGLVGQSASSNASAVSRGGQGASAVASASAYSDANGGGGGGGNAQANANSNVGGLNYFGNFGGAQANSGVFNNFAGAPGFANGQPRFRAFQIRKCESFRYFKKLQQQQQNQTSSSSSPVLEIINDSTKINWPKNSMQLYNHYNQQQQRQPYKQQQLPQSQSQPQPQQLHYSSINPNSSAAEQFTVIDENERNGRTFTFITDLINNMTRPKCTYPCTLEAYEQGRCCENFLVIPQPPALSSSPPPIALRPPLVIPPPPTIALRPPLVIPPPPIPPPPIFSLLSTQFPNFCSPYGYFDPLSCLRYMFGRSVTSTLNIG